VPATFPLSESVKREIAANREYPRNEVRDGFAEFLQRWRWDYFITVSFRTPRQPFHALSTVSEVARVIKARSDGRFFLGTELHLNRTLHVHGLFQSTAVSNVARGVTAQYLWQDFFEAFGRSQVRKVRSREAVSNYCSKYVTKELTEWEFHL